MSDLGLVGGKPSGDLKREKVCNDFPLGASSLSPGLRRIAKDILLDAFGWSGDFAPP
jgi:hypothetical protein